jgi:hypothetical protein
VIPPIKTQGVHNPLQLSFFFGVGTGTGSVDSISYRAYCIRLNGNTIRFASPKSRQNLTVEPPKLPNRLAVCSIHVEWSR